MTFFDVLAGLIIGAYLLTIAVKGNTSKLIDLAKQDKAFLKWALAVALLAYLYRVKELRGVIGLLIVAAFVGFGLKNYSSIEKNAVSFWDSLSSKSQHGASGTF
ncbi:MAG: hypothetical protein ACYDAO_09385 [Thermoplasmataceae archaeon]